MISDLGITETRLARRKGSGGTQEFFTPTLISRQEVQRKKHGKSIKHIINI